MVNYSSFLDSSLDSHVPCRRREDNAVCLLEATLNRLDA